MAETQAQEKSKATGVPQKQADGDWVATEKQNDKLEHSEGGVTTRDDAHDLGVPMLPGDPSEPSGPEDPLGEGATRGDYRARLLPGYDPHQGVELENGGEPVTRKDDDGNEVVVDYTPRSAVVPQRPRADEIGDVEGKKGGVDTA